jgi:hypothetical protein
VKDLRHFSSNSLQALPCLRFSRRSKTYKQLSKKGSVTKTEDYNRRKVFVICKVQFGTWPISHSACGPEKSWFELSISPRQFVVQ